LDIGNTYFSFDGIPTVLGNLVKLTALDVSYTLMFGPMRATAVFGKLRSLVQLEMGGNSYNQSIPIEISTLPNLTNFYCDNADITGDLNFMLDMPSIFEIWLDRNPALGGTIPSGIGTKSSTLQSISFSECALEGQIPSELGSLTLLQQLWLNNNQLTGNIPTTLSGMIQFYSFDVSNNQLVGDLPTAMCTAITPWQDLCTDCDTVKCCCCTCCKSTTC
jgi:Leucine-rich repeat (LRR) protein